MSELTDLYQEVILDHNRRPHNFRVIDGANAKQEGMLRRRPKNNPQVDRKLRPRNSIFPKEKQAVLRTEAPQKLSFRALRTGIAA